MKEIETNNNQSARYFFNTPRTASSAETLAGIGRWNVRFHVGVVVGDDLPFAFVLAGHCVTEVRAA